MRAMNGGGGRLAIVALACAAVTAGCSGSGSDSAAQQSSTYRVVANVSGLAGSGLVLHSSLGDDLPVAANGPLPFPTRAPGGAVITVTVSHQPISPWQTCAVAGGGTMGSQDMAVPVACVTDRFRVGGSVSGLTGTGLVLQNNGADDLAVAASGGFTFATRVASGGAYGVAVKTQPTGQTCSVTGGSGTVGGADVTGVAIACADAPTYRIVATVSGLTGTGLVLHSSLGDDLAVASSGEVAFATQATAGTAYEVTVGAQPTSPWQTCTPTAGGTGTMGSADASVTVTCVTRSFAIGGTVRGLLGSGLVLQNGAESLPATSGPFTFATPVLSGATFEVSVGTQPSAPAQTCTIANGAGTVAGANVVDVLVSCSSAIQAWAAPATWGGLWPDGPTMLQHARFDAGGIVSVKGPTLVMAGGAEPPPMALTGLPAPAGTRWAGGPFPAEAVSYRGANAGALDLPGDMLVCAVVKPSQNRPYDGFESPIVAKGVADGRISLAGGGWVLRQMRESWNFSYQYRDGNGDTHEFFSYVLDFFADQDVYGLLVPPQQLPDALHEPDPSYVVVCGGRSGDQIVIAVNSWTLGASAEFSLARTQDGSGPSPFPGPYALDAATSTPLTIGGFAATSGALHALYPDAFLDSEHVFDGFVYETAVWNEPATAENIQAKMAPFLGLAPSTSYARNREATYVDGDGKMHVVGRHAPRLDPTRGQLFGLQSWNRVSYWIEGNAVYPYPLVFAAGENLDVWTRTPASGGSAPTVALDPMVSPPGDLPLRQAQLVTLPPGAALSIELDQAPPAAPGAPVPVPHARNRATWDATGPIQGQLWLRPGSAGTLSIQKTDPAPGHGASCTVLGASAPCESRDVDLSTLTAGRWSRVSLAQAFTADATVDGTGRTLHRGTLVLANPGPDPISFHAWGVQLTQLGGGGDLGAFDPAELMYDWSASRGNDGEPGDDPWYTIDGLTLAPVPESTAATGFCLGVEATMPAGLPWSAPFARARTAVAWVNDPATPTRTARLYVAGQDGSAEAGQLCFAVGAATVTTVCGALPDAWSGDGARHSVKACMSAAGQMRVFGDDVQLATVAGGITTPDLSGGTILVGNGDVLPSAQLTPWHGYVSRALVCRDTGDVADCN